MEKIVRTICEFNSANTDISWKRLEEKRRKCEDLGFAVQTLRMVYPGQVATALSAPRDDTHLVGLGIRQIEEVRETLGAFTDNRYVSMSVDMTALQDVTPVTDTIFALASDAPHKMFEFSAVARPSLSSPFFPAAGYCRDGYSIGLQATNLRAVGEGLEGWLERMRGVWQEVAETFSDDGDFLGIDSSLAPMGAGMGSLADAATSLKGSFRMAAISDFYCQISDWLKSQNPIPCGYCGLMFPCLEDKGLAQLYETGDFAVSMALYLALHSGVGLDTYPLALDENPCHVSDVLRLVQRLSRKHAKSLSVRFVSDGRAKIGELTNFNNPYLQDVTMRALA